jgi:hypothetical protein
MIDSVWGWLSAGGLAFERVQPPERRLQPKLAALQDRRIFMASTGPEARDDVKSQCHESIAVNRE